MSARERYQLPSGSSADPTGLTLVGHHLGVEPRKFRRQLVTAVLNPPVVSLPSSGVLDCFDRIRPLPWAGQRPASTGPTIRSANRSSGSYATAAVTESAGIVEDRRSAAVSS
jgi:hypothetical protein